MGMGRARGDSRGGTAQFRSTCTRNPWSRDYAVNAIRIPQPPQPGAMGVNLTPAGNLPAPRSRGPLVAYAPRPSTSPAAQATVWPTWLQPNVGLILGNISGKPFPAMAAAGSGGGGPGGPPSGGGGSDPDSGLAGVGKGE